MRFRSFDQLRVFNVVATQNSFADAAEVLHLTKGAISYQIRQLEQELGFEVFTRSKRGARLNAKGERLWHASRVMFESLERQIDDLRIDGEAQITIAMATYFAARWLSPRLMTFTAANPDIVIRLQPSVGQIEPGRDSVDMAIRWGTGEWDDVVSERLLTCPAILVAAPGVAAQLQAENLDDRLSAVTLLDDDQHSSAWADWLVASGLGPRQARERLVIPDPNVRLQAVLDGQGVAFYDWLADPEIATGRLTVVNDVRLPNYGYHLIYRRGSLANWALKEFRDWIVIEASSEEIIER
ncbi:MAG: LysR substrate-binding domain-containing protein [Rhodospirillales bacterium]